MKFRINRTMLMFALAGASLLTAASATAQTAASQDNAVISDQDIQLLRQDIRSQKKQLVASNLKLTDAEATKFWPIYDQYTTELATINNDKYAVIKEYTNNYGSLTDAQSLTLMTKSLAVTTRSRSCASSMCRW